MSVVNRVWDTVQGGLVRWRTGDPDPGGFFYPGPGTFGVNTSDYVIEDLREEQAIAQPVAPTLAVPVGTVQGLWLFDESLLDQSPNGLTLTAVTLTERYTPSTVPGARGFFKNGPNLGYLVENTASAALQISGAMTCEVMFKPPSVFIGIGTGGGFPFLFMTQFPGAGAANNTGWGMVIEENTNQFQYFHEYSTGSPNQHFVSSGVILSPQRWHHLAFTRDSAGTFIRMYVNGLLVHREVVGNAPAPGANSRLVIGDESVGTVRVDGVWAWGRVTDDEFRPEHILASARATLPPDLRP